MIVTSTIEELSILKGQVKKAIHELQNQADSNNYTFDVVAYVNRIFYKNGLDDFFYTIRELILRIPEEKRSDFYTEEEMFADWDRLDELFEEFEMNGYRGF